MWGGRIRLRIDAHQSYQCGAQGFGDSGQEQRLIRTIARKGFRFVGDVREGQPSVGLRSASAGAADANEPSAHALTLPDNPSIAALPFMNLSGDPAQEYFADGVVEDIISALSRIGWLFRPSSALQSLASARRNTAQTGRSAAFRPLWL